MSTRYGYSKAYSQYGASMGRPSWTVDNGDPTGPKADSRRSVKVHLERVPLDQGGYDPGGAYWGTPHDLFVAFSDDGTVQLFVRASVEMYGSRFASREQAKVKVRERLPNVRFYR